MGSKKGRTNRPEPSRLTASERNTSARDRNLHQLADRRKPRNVCRCNLRESNDDEGTVAPDVEQQYRFRSWTMVDVELRLLATRAP